MAQDPLISVVVPCYNEEDSLPEMYRRLSEVLVNTGLRWEIVLINDGSRDLTEEVMRRLYSDDPAHIRVIQFARNFGHQIAVTAGMSYAAGDVVVLIDADLQDPPELIHEMLKKWREGYDVVFAVRKSREGENAFKKATASLFYRLLEKITEVKIPLDTGDFRLMDRRVVDAVNSMKEHNRFLRGMVTWVGYRQTGLEYERAPRYAGESKYPFIKMLRLAWDGVTGFSYFPLQLATYLGFIIAALSVVMIVVVIAIRLFSEVEPLKGQATTLVMVLFLGGVQLMTLGIIGEYLGRIYNEVRDRPLYVVSEIMGIENSPKNEG